LIEQYGDFKIAGNKTQGAHVTSVTYTYQKDKNSPKTQWQNQILAPTAIPTISKADLKLLNDKWGSKGYTFVVSKQKLALKSLIVRGYTAYQDGNGVTAGAEIFLQYNPTGVDPKDIKWIQIWDWPQATASYNDFPAFLWRGL
jgi:hypothetical protein